MRLTLTTDDGTLLDSTTITHDRWDRLNAITALALLGELEAGSTDPDAPTGPAPVTDLAHVVMVDPKAWAAYGEADVRPCRHRGMHVRTQRHPRSVCPLYAPGTPMGE